MKKHRNKIIAAVLIALSLAIAYFWSGSVPDYGKKNGLETSISEQKKTADKQKHTKKNTALSKETQLPKKKTMPTRTKANIHVRFP